MSNASTPSSTSSSSVPIVVINTPQAVRPYSGQSSWSSFKDQFERVAKVNKWDTDAIKAQHLQLSLESSAAECLKELDESSPRLYQEIWEVLKRRFGDVDEQRTAMTKFEHRKQHDGESVVEFEQALRALYRVAWPKATEDQKNVALKARFEQGLQNADMQQYLRLHASTDDFAATVQKARRFASTTEPQTRPRKTVRINTPPPSHDAVQMLQSDTSFHDRMDKIEDMIRSLQTTPPKIEKPQTGSSVKSVNPGEKSPRPPPAQQSKGERAHSKDRNNNNRSPGWQNSNRQNSSKPYARPFESRSNNQFGPRQSNSNFANASGRNTPQQGQQSHPSQGYQNRQFGSSWNAGPRYGSRPPQRRGCWVCGQPGCHSSNHEPRPQTPPARQNWNNSGWRNEGRSQTPPPRPNWNSNGWRNDNRPQTPPANPNWTSSPQQSYAPPLMGEDNCWVCGNFGCRARYHSEDNRPRTPTMPPQSQTGNASGTRSTGNRGPTQPARPQSN